MARAAAAPAVRTWCPMSARALIVVAVLTLIASGSRAQQRAESQANSDDPFVPEEATISDIHAALAAGRTTCVQVAQSYLRRIDAYDDRGPVLNAIITINPNALETAADLDRVRAGSGSSLRPLHCVPVVLKDNLTDWRAEVRR